MRARKVKSPLKFLFSIHLNFRRGNVYKEKTDSNRGKRKKLQKLPAEKGNSERQMGIPQLSCIPVTRP